MKRIYKINELTLIVSATIKTLPFNVWRDVSRFSYQSTDLADGLGGGYSIYRFATKAGLEDAAEVLQGALFSEVTAEEWEKFRDVGDE